MPSKAGAQKNEWLTYLAECAKRYKAGHKHSPAGHAAKEEQPLLEPKAPTKRRIVGKQTLQPTGAAERRVVGKQPPSAIVGARPKAKAKSKPLTEKDTKKLNQDVKRAGKKRAKEAQAKEAKAGKIK